MPEEVTEMGCTVRGEVVADLANADPSAVQAGGIQRPSSRRMWAITIPSPPARPTTP